MNNCGAITSHLRWAPATGGNWDWDPDQRHSSSCHRAFFSCGSVIVNKGCISVEQIPADLRMLIHFTGPMLPNQLFVSQLEIFHGGNFCRSVFLALLLQAAVAEAFLPLPSPPLPRGNSMGSPPLRPHAATKLSAPGGDGLVQSLGPCLCGWRVALCTQGHSLHLGGAEGNSCSLLSYCHCMQCCVIKPLIFA